MSLPCWVTLCGAIEVHVCLKKRLRQLMFYDWKMDEQYDFLIETTCLETKHLDSNRCREGKKYFTEEP
jgi:hypothetical protein